MSDTSFVKILLTAATTTAVLYSFSAGNVIIPSKYYKRQPAYERTFDWEKYGTTSYYSIGAAESEIFSQAEILNKFASNILENTKDLDSSIAEAINDNFSELF